MARSSRRLSVLLLCDDNPAHAGNLLEHIDALTGLSRHRVRRFNPRGLEKSSALRLEAFDVVVIHYSLLVISDYLLAPAFRERIRDFRGLKVQFLQDDYRWVDEITETMRFLGIHVLYTLVRPDRAPLVFGPRLPGVELVSTLPAYVPEGLGARPVPPVAARPLDIGYRGRTVPFWLGRLGQEKKTIGEGVAARLPGTGLRADIAWGESDRIYGESWYRFLSSCRTTLGSEGGSSIVDFDGSLQRRVDAYLEERPDATFEEVHERILEPYEGNVPVNVLPPRVFEAAALRTGLVLFEGEYAGVVEPERHYVPLAKDFSNFGEVVAAIRRPERIQAQVDRTHADIVASGEYSLRRLVEEFDALLAGRAEPRASTALGPLSLRLAAAEIDARRHADELGTRLARAPADARLARQRTLIWAAPYLRRAGISRSRSPYVAATRALKLWAVLARPSLRALLLRGLRAAPQPLAVRELLVDLRRLDVVQRRLSGRAGERVRVVPAFDGEAGELSLHATESDATPEGGLDEFSGALARGEAPRIVCWAPPLPAGAGVRLTALERLAPRFPKETVSAVRAALDPG